MHEPAIRDWGETSSRLPEKRGGDIQITTTSRPQSVRFQALHVPLFALVREPRLWTAQTRPSACAGVILTG